MLVAIDNSKYHVFFSASGTRPQMRYLITGEKRDGGGKFMESQFGAA